MGRVMMKSKILFLYGPLGGGGAERVLLDLLNNLDYTKYDVDLCLFVNQGILLSEVPKQVTVFSLWDHYSYYYKIAFRASVWFGNNFLFKRVLKRKITKKYDAEISFLEGIPLKLHALMNNKAKKITWVHADLLNYSYTDKQFATNEQLGAYNKMDAIVCVSNFTLQMFEQKFNGLQDKLKIIYNPVDLIKVERLSVDVQVKKKSAFNIVSVGRLTDQKRFDRLLRVVARLRKEKYDLNVHIVGDGELRDDLKRLCKVLEIDDIVEFVGFVNNPYPYIKNADLMVVPSASEGFGLVVVEAMALGVPVVSTKTAGPMEIIEQDAYGLLCEHDDESIYQFVKKLIEDEKLREHYKQQGLIRSKDFNVKRTVQAFDELIENLR